METNESAEFPTMLPHAFGAEGRPCRSDSGPVGPAASVRVHTETSGHRPLSGEQATAVAARREPGRYAYTAPAGSSPIRARARAAP